MDNQSKKPVNKTGNDLDSTTWLLKESTELLEVQDLPSINNEAHLSLKKSLSQLYSPDITTEIGIELTSLQKIRVVLFSLCTLFILSQIILSISFRLTPPENFTQFQTSYHTFTLIYFLTILFLVVALVWGILTYAIELRLRIKAWDFHENSVKDKSK